MSTILGAILPAETDEEALAENKTWRLIFAVQPIMLILTIVLFVTVIGTDTPRFYIQQGDHDKAKEVISTIYNVRGDQTKLDNIYLAERLAANVDEGSEEGAPKLTMKQVLWTDERYSRSS